MKKCLTLLMLSLLSVCLLLVSCGDAGETSSAATSSEVPAVSETESCSADSEKPAESEEASSEAGTGESSQTPVQEARTFWVTHYDDGQAEGAGSIFTATDTAGAWAAHVAFKPVSGDVYEIVELSDGISGGGNGTALTVPEGGFVWAINAGNDWPALIENATGTEWYYDDAHKAMPDYTSEACDTMIADMRSWMIGDQIRFTGLDLEGQTIPTDTPDLAWYESDYVCTATWEFAN